MRRYMEGKKGERGKGGKGKGLFQPYNLLALQSYNYSTIRKYCVFLGMEQIEIDNLWNLLLSEDEAQRELAHQLMQGLGMPEQIALFEAEWEPIWAKISKYPLSKNFIYQCAQTTEVRLDSVSMVDFPTIWRPFLKLKALYFYQNNCKEVPENLTTLQNLEVFWANNNLLEALPAHFRRLTKLKKLALAGNKFTKFPEVICDLPALEELHIGRTPLTELPDGIQTLPALKSLALMGNNFSEAEQKRIKAMLPHVKVCF